MSNDPKDQSQYRRDPRLAVKVLLIIGITLALFLWMNPSFGQRFGTLRSMTGKGIFIVTFALAWGALLACSIAPRGWAVVFFLFFAGNLLISTTYAKVMGRSMSLNDAQNLREAMGSLMDAVHQYGSTVGVVALVITAMMALLLWTRKLVLKRSRLPLLACSLGVTLSYGSFLTRGGTTSMLFFPANFESGMHALALTLEPFVRHRGSKAEVQIPIVNLPLDPAVKHVVLIIDESIEANVFERAMQSASIGNAVDLGIGYSFENNSAGSNLLLRRTADPNAVDQSIHQFPSVFEQAKRNGFFTHYLDAQGILSDSDVQDYFDAKDKDFIDDLPPLKEYGARHERDINAARLLINALKTHEKTFTLLNKQGSHFPYIKNLPPEMASVVDPYRASVERTSVGFLAQITPSLPPGTLVFYTSDHGQNFHGRAPHNNAPGECTVSEWQVPMVLLFSPDLKPWADRIRPEWKNCATHGAMAETLRNLLGTRNPSQLSLLTPPTPEVVARHRGYYGSPKGLFGEPVLSLWIDKQQRTFLASNKP